jgi:hypothetical protein
VRRGDGGGVAWRASGNVRRRQFVVGPEEIAVRGEIVGVGVHRGGGGVWEDHQGVCQLLQRQHSATSYRRSSLGTLRSRPHTHLSQQVTGSPPAAVSCA